MAGPRLHSIPECWWAAGITWPVPIPPATLCCFLRADALLVAKKPPTWTAGLQGRPGCGP